MKLRKVLSLFVALVMMFEVLPLSSLATEIADATENVEVSAEAVEEKTETEEAGESIEEAVEEEAAVLLGTTADESGIATVSEDEETEETDSEITDISSLFAGGDGTEENPYQVATAEQLDAVRNDLTACYIQVADIDLSGIEWTPIGKLGLSYAGNDKYFTGQYDGNNYKIENMTITTVSDDMRGYGLFACIDDKAVLENITLEGVSITVDWSALTNDSIVLGAIVGSASSKTTVQNCTVSGEIVVANVRIGHIGGIVGYGAASYCTNYASINVTSAPDEGDSGSIHCGGICGDTSTVNSDVTHNINYGSIVASANTFLYCGGISGEYGAISYCVNYGNISGEIVAYHGYSAFAYNCNVGGIVGATSSDTNDKCVNFGNTSSVVTSNNGSCSAGGIAGYIGYYSSGTISNCYNLCDKVCAETDGQSAVYSVARFGRISGRVIENNTSDCYSIDTTTINGVAPAGSDTGASTIHGESMSEAEIASAIKPILDELGLEYDYSYSGSYGSVYYLTSYNEETGVLELGGNLYDVYVLGDDVDTAGISDMVGSFVLITKEQDEDNVLNYTVTSIVPVESAIGEVTEQGSSTLTIDGTTYPVRDDYILGSYEGDELLYHVYDGTIVGYSLPETSMGTLDEWDNTASTVTIDGTVYPVLSVTDLSFLANLDAYLGNKVTLVTYDVSGYTIVGSIGSVEESNDNFDSDAYIIEQVLKYTDDGLYAQYTAIVESDDSWDTKYQKFTELFTKYGFLDVSEGIEYISSVRSERRAYLMLTNNEMYTCYLYWDWLNNSVRGRATKVLMVADGLAFNNELNTWLNPLTWVGAKDTPGVSKYKDVLYDFMDSMALEIEVTDTISSLKSIAKNATEAGKLYANSLIAKLNECASIEEVQTVITSNEAKGVFAELNKNSEGKYKFSLSDSSGYGQFCTAMGYATTSISIATSLVEDISDLILLSSNLALYTEYLDFLNEVMYATDLPWEMRLAACEIVVEIEQGAWAEFIDIAIDVIDATGVTGIAKEGLISGIVGAAGYTSFSECLLVMNITTFCINKVFDIGALVKGTAYVEGYAYLSMHYRNNLVESKSNFLLNQTAENAWDFFENYNILYQLRYKGEQAVLNMFQFDGLIGDYLSDWADYAYKEEVVSSVLDNLEDCRFNISSDVEIPESVQYSYKAVISCPVDVEVYAPDGTYITTLYDGVESDLTNEYGRFAVVYRDYTGTYAKVVCLYQEGDYTFKATGTDEGLVNFELASLTVDSSAEYTFTNEEISEGTVFIISTDAAINENTYDVDSDGDGVVDYQSNIATITEDSYLAVESVSLDVDAIELDVDDSYLLSVTIAPSDATRKNVIWVSSDSSVAEISTGKIEAKSVGTATISCISQDNAELIATCEVNVIDSSELIAETKTTLSSTDWTLTQSDVESATGSTTADKIATLIDAILAELGIDSNVTVTYTITDITEAIAGDATDVDGTDGSFTINFTISSGNESDTLTETGTITATAYVHTHSLTHVEAVDATCTAEGNTEYWYCSGCDKYYSDENAENEITLADTVTAKIAHNYEAVVTEPTCTESGYTTYTCSVCKDSYIADETAALGHDYTSEVTKEATCTEAGVMTYTCTRGDDSYTEEIPATGHTEAEAVVENEVAATCTTDGSYDSVVYCSICHEELSREAIVVPAAHTAGTAVRENIVEATRTTEGSYDLVTYCTVCGEEISRETVTVPATGVDMITVWLRTPADYSAVNKAIAKANALNPDEYTNFSDVTDAINAVNWTYNALMQSYVNEMAEKIETAIANLIPVGTTTEEVEIHEPIEDTNTDTEDDDEESSESSEPETNPTTGIAFSILPMMIAALAAASSKRR